MTERKPVESPLVELPVHELPVHGSAQAVNSSKAQPALVTVCPSGSILLAGLKTRLKTGSVRTRQVERKRLVPAKQYQISLGLLELLVALLVGGAYLVFSVDAEDVPEYE